MTSSRLGRRWRRVLGIAAVATTVSGPSLVGVTSATAQGEAVQVWMTSATPGGTLAQGLTPQPAVSFGSPTSQGPVINVDPNTAYQTIQGFGGAMTDTAANLIYNSPERSEILQDLFGSSGGGFSFIRLPMGASDLSLGNYSYDDMPAGQTDPSLSHFSVAHDTAYIIPTLQQALADNPNLKIVATPWSAPAWMKQGDTFVGDCSGTLNYLNPSYYAAYAQYYAKFVQAYQGTYGIPISMVGMQNEPENCNSGYATMNFDASGPNPNEAAFSPYLRAALNSAGYSGVQIMGYDHNWYESNGSPTTYPQALMANAPAGDVGAIGYHCYNTPSGVSDPYDVQSTFHNAYPNTPIYFTECSGGSWATNQASNLDWEALNDVIGPMNNWATASDFWTIATDPQSGPNVGGGCTTCRGMVTVDNTNGTFTLNEDYYVWAQFAKFVRPGAMRIASPNLESSDLPNVAFKNPDGSLVLVVLNDNTSSSQSFQVQWNGEGLDYSLPPNALATFTWSPSGTAPPATSATAALGTNCTASVGGSALNRSGWSASTNAPSSGSDVASNAIDGNLATRFSTDEAQADGLYWQADLGSTQSFDEVEMQAPNSSGDYARSYDVEVSGDGSTWTTVASCSGTGDPEVVSFPTVNARYVRLVDTNLLDGLATSTGSWWSIDELNLFANGSVGSSGPASGAWYEVVNKNSGLCVDDSGWGTANGTAVQQWACGSSPQSNQEWQFQPTSGGYYDVLNRNAAGQGEVWDVTGGAGATASGTLIQTWAFGGGTNQQWQPVALGNGYYQLVARNSGLCLDVPSASTANGVQLQQYTCNGTGAQAWQLTAEP